MLKEIRERLGFLHNVGLHYLTLDRAAPTLSGGEAQRIRLASQIGSGLVGVMYILDEPSIGLHQRDNRKLLDSLLRLRDLGNTLIVVEHDLETMQAADWIIDFGPGAGVKGGQIVTAGTPDQVAQHPTSLTGQYLSGRLTIHIPTSRRSATKGWLTLEGATLNNLRDVTVSFPLGCFIAVTGVSGSGKSSLITETLYPALANRLNRAQLKPGPFRNLYGLEQLDKVINIDQQPIGRTPRSNPATYVKLFDLLRELFAETPEAKLRGYGPGRFSFNLKGGRCEACEGNGEIKIDMQFLADVWVRCAECKGKRYNRETLQVKYKGKTIATCSIWMCKRRWSFSPTCHGYAGFCKPCTMLASTTSNSVNRRPPSLAVKPSASNWRRNWRAWQPVAPSTFSMNQPPVYTLPIFKTCCGCCTVWLMPATRLS